MIVSSMTVQEICKELLSEKDYLCRKTKYCVEDIKRAARKLKRYPCTKSYTSRTAKKKLLNTITLTVNSKLSLDHPCYSTHVFFDLDDGKYAVNIENGWQSMTIFPPHFFQEVP